MSKLSNKFIWIVAATLSGCANQQSADQSTPPAETQAPAATATETTDAPAKVAVDANGQALGGFDAVAYHMESKAIPGDPQYAVEHEGATYLFASEDNKKMFEADPAKYAPAYGGYCAFGVANDSLLPANPESFTVQDGTLYMFFKGDFGGKQIDTLPAWQQDAPGLKSKADTNWDAGTPQPPPAPGSAPPPAE